LTTTTIHPEDIKRWIGEWIAEQKKEYMLIAGYQKNI
jgi:hypothetical protein